MKKLLIIFALLFGLAQASGATYTVTGELMEKDGTRPIEFATVTLYNAPDSTLLTGALTDSLGRFKITDVPSGTYYIWCKSIGFKDLRTRTFTLKSSSYSLPRLFMLSNEQNLNEVVVTGRKSSYTQKLDRKVFNVGSDLTATTGSLSDLMQNVPSLDVDLDGNISLRGNENVTILIDGKPSALMNSKNRADALQQLAATNVERIEIITNPSAEFKPDGVGGIINIVMKRDRREGLNGTASVNGGNKGRYNAGINLSQQLGKLHLNAGYAFRHDNFERFTNDNRSYSSSFVHQTSHWLGHPDTHTVNIGASCDLSDKDHLDLSASYGRRIFTRNEYLTSIAQDSLNTTTEWYLRNRYAKAHENLWDESAQYAHNYGRFNSEWGVDYTYSSESENEMNNYSTRNLTGTATDSKDNQHVWDYQNLYNLKAYVHHNFSKKLHLTAGYEWEHIRAEQNFHLQDWNGTQFVDNKEESSDFTNLRQTHAFFSTLQWETGKWEMMAGLRAEFTREKLKLLSLDSVMHNNYNGLYPTLHLSRKISAFSQLQLSYSLRVNRPDGEDMNPFAEHINPLSLESGNPNLKPEKIHSLEAAWLWNNNKQTTLSTTLYYRYLTNKITTVSYYIDNGVLLTTKANMNNSREAGAEIILTQSVGKWLSLNADWNGYYNQIDAHKLGYGKNKDTFSWSGQLNANITPWRHFMLQINNTYRSSTLVPQGRRNADFRFNIGAKYDIVKVPGLSVIASVSDLFDTARKSYTLNTPELHQKYKKTRSPRIAYVGLIYNFGQKARKKGSNKIEYDENL